MLIDRINIQAPENSPHTDGIHMANSNNIQILNSEISTGDDCASMGPGSQNVNISSNVKIWPSNVESALGALVEPQTKKESVKLQCKIVTSLKWCQDQNLSKIFKFIVSLSWPHYIKILVPTLLTINCFLSFVCLQPISNVKISHVKFRGHRARK